MPKIKRVTQPNIRPPDLTSIGQNINIPRGAFGENVDEAISNLGRSVEFSAQKLGDAFARQEERRAIREASEAFKDVPINEVNALNEAKKNPGPLDQFQLTQTKALDDRMKAIRDGLSSERAKLRFDQLVLPTRTSMAKNAATWARTQEVVEARSTLSSNLQDQINAAPRDIGNLQTYRDVATERIKQAEANGSLIGVDSKKLIRNTLRSIDLAVANSLIPNNPSFLLRMIKDGELPELAKDKDLERKKISQANSSRKSIREKAEFSRFSAQVSKFPELSKRIDSGDPTLSVAEIENSDLPDWAKDYWIEELSGSIEGRIRKTVEQGKILEEAKRRLGKVTGKKAKAKEFDKVLVRDITVADLNSEFLRIAGIDAIEDFTGIKRLNETLGFIQKIVEAHRAKEIYKSDRVTYLELLTPSLTEMIDSKYWEGRDNKDSALSKVGGILQGSPAIALAFKVVNKIMGGATRERNVYADFYNNALATLEFFPVVNNEPGRVMAMSNVIKHIEIASKLEGQEQLEYIPKIARNAVIDIMYEKFEETKDIPYDDYFTAIGIRVPVEGATVEPADSLRPDGTRKGTGFLGVLQMRDGSGRSTTEQSIDVDIDGKKTLIPLIVSTTTEKDLDILLSDVELKDIPQSIIDKAITHAKKRIKQGLSPFKESEKPFSEAKQAKIDAFFEGK